jgi:hypothetical protein
MHKETGIILDRESVNALPRSQRDKFIEVRRDLTAKEVSDKQIRLYSPCGCGSGKKFKFCCKTALSGKDIEQYKSSEISLMLDESTMTMVAVKEKQ